MASGAGAALHRKSYRLVENQDVVVFVERDQLEEGAVLLRLRRIFTRFRRREVERRNAHRLPCFQTRFRLCALAVHAHFAFADDALDVAERQARKVRLEESVDAHVVFVAGNCDGSHADRKSLCFVILRCVALLEECMARAGGLRNSLRSHLKMTAKMLRSTAVPMSWPGLLSSAAGLTRAIASAAHE